MKKINLYQLTIRPEHTSAREQLIFTCEPTTAMVVNVLKAMAEATAVTDEDDDYDGYRQDQADDRVAFLDCCHQIAERMQPLKADTPGQTIFFAGVRVGYITFDTTEAWAP